MNYQEHITRSIELAEAQDSKLTEDDFSSLSYGDHPHQMSSRKIKHLLNNLCSFSGCKHLAIGLYRGGSLCASLKGNFDVVVTAIDNWSIPDENATELRDDFYNRFEPYDNGKVTIVEKDCFSVDVSTLGSHYNLYFYDAGHTEEDQRMAITYYADCLADECIIIVDDFNLEEVRNGTYDGLRLAGFDVVYESKLFTSRNGDTGSWWNGLLVALIKKKK